MIDLAVAIQSRTKVRASECRRRLEDAATALVTSLAEGGSVVWPGVGTFQSSLVDSDQGPFHGHRVEIRFIPDIQLAAKVERACPYIQEVFGHGTQGPCQSYNQVAGS